MAEKLPELGDKVIYVSSKGYQKLAFVIGTPAEVEPGHDLPTLVDGMVNLVVISAQGKITPRYAVPSKELATTVPDFATGDGESKGIWKPFGPAAE